MPIGQLADVEYGSTAEVVAAVRVHGDCPALVADEFLLANGHLDSLVDAVDSSDSIPVPPGEPSSESVKTITACLREDTDVIVAVGGGSSLDSAKLAAGLARSDHRLVEHLGGATPFGTTIPVVAVPTTAGSGAEVTRTCVVNVGDRKYWAWDKALRPVAAVLDPAMTVSLPESTTVASGLDAFVHAVESATAQIRNPAAESAGLWAVGRIYETLPRVVANPDDLPARRTMLGAACAAGAGIDRCGTGIGHAIGHALGSMVRLPHGLAVMLGTLVAIEWSVAGAMERFEPVATAIEPGARPTDMGQMVVGLADAVGFERQIGPFVRSVDLDATEFATELARVEHRPMRLNNSTMPTDDEVLRLAGETVAAWRRIAALA